MKKSLLIYLKAFRVPQWSKNFVVFTAILFSGTLFDLPSFSSALYAFYLFCILSSTSYLLNDVLDVHYDRLHPTKKNRPIASGQVTLPQATFLVFTLSLISLILAIFFSLGLFVVALAFLLLHFFYSMYLKRYPLIDIFTISFSFLIRTVAGEIATGSHIPIWLYLTVFFISLFMASVKRHAEYVLQGTKSREALKSYREHLLMFLTNTFATSTIITYALYTYIEPPTIPTPFLAPLFPNFEGRKWLMVTIPLVVYGIARYAQLLYEREQGERPEEIITTDKPLIAVMLLWGVIVVGLIYVF